MSIFNLDDHYNQTPYRLEKDDVGIRTLPPGRHYFWNDTLIFNRSANPMFIFNTQPGFRDKWFIGKGIKI